MGRPVLAGFEFDFSTSMNPVTTGNSDNFRLGKIRHQACQAESRQGAPSRYASRRDSTPRTIR